MTAARVLITGVHRGLGHALASGCLERGERVFGLSRAGPDDLIEHPGFRFEQVDLSRPEQIEPALGRLLDGVGRLDLVLLNAGILGAIQDLSATSMEEIDRVMTVNVWANKHLFDGLLRLGVAIDQLVAISSGAAVNGSGGWGAYSISKAALNLLFRVYADEHPETRFTCLAPGLVWTEMLQGIASAAADDRYPAVGRIKSAVGSDGIQTTQQAARRILDCLPVLRESPSGAYLDIREI